MASSGNTWTKKLLNKQRLHVLKVKGIKSRFAVDLETSTVVERVRKFNAPMKAGFAPRPFGKRHKDRAGLFNAR